MCDYAPVGYYIRFLQEDGAPLTLDEVIAGLRADDAGFSLSDSGDLSRDGELLAELEVNRPGDGTFDDEIRELRESAEVAEGTDVARRLDSVTVILAVRILFQARGAEKTFDLLEPLWGWLTASRQGLIHADGEGYYDDGELILAD
jgi:hypothetical protein